VPVQQPNAQTPPRWQGSPQVPPGTPNGRGPNVVNNARRFWQRVTEGRQLNELWFQFRREAQTGYRFYRKDFDADEFAGMSKGKIFLRKAQAFMWAILEKLTPARRVLLLVGAVFLILPSGGVQFEHGNQVQVTTPNFQFWGGVLIFIVLMLEIADRVVMKRDLEIARDIQSWLLPSTPPAVPGMSIAFATRPANTVAGDYYDVFARQGTGDNRFLLAVADVAGKSIPAALLMATFQASLKTLSSVPCSLLELVAGMNRYACCNSQGGLRFTTAFLAEYDGNSRVLSYVNAGHNNPILRRASGQIERLDAGGLPLGIQEDASFSGGSVTVAPGDWLLIFTDGLVEAENGFAEAYGEGRLFNVIQTGVSLTPDLLLQRMITEVNTFVGTTPQHDDITAMLIKAA
jgi:phosphoserine phosphatase RsbU/P